jgi:hypothetical protein
MNILSIKLTVEIHAIKKMIDATKMRIIVDCTKAAIKGGYQGI